MKKTTKLPVNDKRLLEQAFVHRSFLNESPDHNHSNERLEYLGDAVLELAVSQYLYTKFPKKPEGDLTALRAALVKTTTLATAAEKLNLGSKLMMSKGEIQTGGRSNQSLLANTFEALIGAIYLDSNLDVVTNFLQDNLYPFLKEILEKNLHRDYKSSFQELVQSKGRPTPTYQVVSQQGPDHDKTFTMSLNINEEQISTGTGKSKQLAEQDAARIGLEKLDENNNL